MTSNTNTQTRPLRLDPAFLPNLITIVILSAILFLIILLCFLHEPLKTYHTRSQAINKPLPLSIGPSRKISHEKFRRLDAIKASGLCRSCPCWKVLGSRSICPYCEPQDGEDGKRKRRR